VRVAVEVALDLGQHQFVGDGMRQRIGLAAADDEDPGHVGRGSQRRVERRPPPRHPAACQPGWRVSTMLRRPGSGRKRAGSESQVARPMMTGRPCVVAEVRMVLRQAPDQFRLPCR
jgi:hypothetical protein